MCWRVLTMSAELDAVLEVSQGHSGPRAGVRGESDSSGAEAVAEAGLDLVGERTGDAGGESVDQAPEQWPPDPDWGGLRRHPRQFSRDLDGPLQVADLVDETELERLVAQPDLAGRELQDALAAEPAS